MDDWIKQFFINNDPLKGYVADTIGSELVESTADIVETRITEAIKRLDMNCTNRYSPGYCGWDVSEQHKLFSLLPAGFCGVKLTPSALMTPIKSISGIIGIGPLCRKKEYQCSLCDLKDCYKRVHQSNPAG